MPLKRSRVSVVSWILVVLGAAGIAAQSPPDQQRMASQLRKNQEELQSYTWRSRYTYTVDGVTKREDVYTVRYAFGGMKEKMQISSKVDKEKVRRPDGSKLKKKEREAAYAFVMEVKSQLDAYLNPLFSEKAVATATMTTSGDVLVLESSDVVTPGDSVTIHYSLPSRLPRTAAITTTVGESPVSLEVEFGALEYGPNYPARSVTTATWQSFRLEITTENSDYEQVKR